MADKNKIRVYGKAQNRTALGIVHAYCLMNPGVSLEGLRKAFPNSICPDAGVKELFLPVDEAEKFNTKMSLYFTKPDEVFVLKDGSKVALSQVWSKTSFDRIVEQGKLNEIEVAEFEKTMKFEKGGYRLEYLNGYLPPVPKVEMKMKVPVVEMKVKAGMPWWLWLLLLLIIVGAVVWFFMNREPRTVEVEKRVEVEKEVVVRDTVFIEQVQEIEANFNAAQFAKGKADLNDDAKFALHDLAKLMKQNPKIRLYVVGHTSVEGNAEVNQKLSEDRAKATVDFLTTKEGIDPSRITAVGKGSSELKDPENPTSEVNRRTEFKIITD